MIFTCPSKVRADTSLSVGEWSDPIIVEVSTSSSSVEDSDSSSISPIAYIVPSVIVGLLLIIIGIIIIVYLIHCYNNRIKYHDTYVSVSTLYS